MVSIFRVQSKKRYAIKDLYHIQNVNAFHSRLKDWLERFKGVASKYLDNYLAWFNFVEKYQFEHIKSKRKGMLIQACINIPLTLITVLGCLNSACNYM
ncbi:hypothetical protein CPJCM30710_25240 [Clostridium polyendosporum]|uniref:Uncharacterized protein n=1 Tax=Clostridium polyendosporum TaxID=69208 RepID=A0A919S3D1_9CLOT|nr:hypothetical protein CPJCM30710_25240 [Clostridium polyendosporum]